MYPGTLSSSGTGNDWGYSYGYPYDGGSLSNEGYISLGGASFRIVTVVKNSNKGRCEFQINGSYPNPVYIYMEGKLILSGSLDWTENLPYNSFDHCIGISPVRLVFSTTPVEGGGI